MAAAFAIVGPVGIRGAFVLEQVCETTVGHAHNYDHVTLVIHGRLKISSRYQREGQTITDEREVGTGEMVTIKAGVVHTLKALEEKTAYHCIFSHRDFDGVVSQAYLGHDAAYV